MPTSVPQTPDGRTPEARVLIVMTGGTICMQKSPTQGLVPARGFLERCMAPRPEFNDGDEIDPISVFTKDGMSEVLLDTLRTPVSKYGKRIRYAVYEFEELLDSSSIDSRGWSQIAETIYYNYTSFDGFVVLHGTDSLAYTASALSFMLQNLGKPVIMTGSQVPFSERKNDALENLLDSLDIAGHFMIPEVCLCFNSLLFRGNRTTKISASSFKAFDSPNLQPLATITAIETIVNWNLIARPTVLEPFSIQTNLDTHHVACLRIFPGITPAMLKAVLDTEHLRGLVLETFGAGNAPTSGHDNAFVKVIAEAINRGVVIVNVTQCLTGGVSPIYAPGLVLGKVGVVAGSDMTSEAALTKLAYLLAKPGASSETVAKDMAQSLRGEMTANQTTVFSHPMNVSLSTNISHLTETAYAVAAGQFDIVKDELKKDISLLDRADYSGNTLLHIAATGPELNILRYLLSLGASVHPRNHTGSGRTALFLAANAGLLPQVQLLRQAGAHLHSDELTTAALHARQPENKDVWKAAGLGLLHRQNTA